MRKQIELNGRSYNFLFNRMNGTNDITREKRKRLHNSISSNIIGI
jgi:hypothetical protein